MGASAPCKHVINRNCYGLCPAVCNLIIIDESTRYSVYFPPLAAFNEGIAEIVCSCISMQLFCQSVQPVHMPFVTDILWMLSSQT